MRRKEERSKQGQINKPKQHSIPKAVTFSNKNELPRVGLEPTTLYTLDRACIGILAILQVLHSPVNQVSFIVIPVSQVSCNAHSC